MGWQRVSISIVIPTFNALGKVEGLLTRLGHFREKYGDSYQVIVADDASSDGTPGEIKRQFPAVAVIENRQNRGFGGNTMTGVAKAQNEYLAVLNNDIELCGDPFPDLIQALIDDPLLFAAMPLIFNRPLDGVENLNRLNFNRGLVWHARLPEEEHWSSVMCELLTRAADVRARLRDIAAKAAPVRCLLCGAAFVCRREQFSKLGGFDTRYQPFYWEDVDLDYRARREGMYCAVVPRAAVIHRHSETIDRYHGLHKLRYLRLNQLRFVLAHLRELIEAGLKAPHIWWGLRALRECFGGDAVLRRAYWRAGIGLKDV
ncbi:glycosyltransferase family 2 protein [bacterium]|nr:glycosyltransferase family 2 protein [bacterium]